MAQDRPSAAELLQAVREFLESDVTNATEGRIKFHTRVSINALAIVERELAATGATAQAAQELERDRDLAGRIRNGSVTPDSVFADIRESVRQKLLVANPKYLAD